MSTAQALSSGKSAISPEGDRTPVASHTTAASTPYLFSTDDLYRMIDREVFPWESRVYLWDGRNYDKIAKTNAHAVSGMKASMTMQRVLPPDWCLSSENPNTVAPDKSPLPDLVVIRGRPDDSLARRPIADDIGLVVELSLSSLKFDTGRKLAAYAAAEIAAYWVVNLVDRVVHVDSDPIPAEGRYALSATYAPGESFPVHLGEEAVGPIAASDLLPGR